MEVILLAGGKCKPDLKELSGCEWRCDLPTKGSTMMDVAVEALAPYGDLVVVGPHAPLGAKKAEPGGSFPQSLERGLELVTSDEIIIATCDMPWLTRESVSGFLEKIPKDAELGYPIISEAECLARFPGLPRTAVSIREGRFTGGNLIWGKTAAMRKLTPWLDRAYELRKSPVALGGMIGWDLLGRLAFGRLAPKTLTIDYMERRITRSIGVQVRGVICPYPEIGTDIDSAEQYKVMLALQKSGI